jgi:hypothetical protein
MESTHKPLHLDEWSFVQQTIMYIPTSLISIIILFDEAFNYGNGAKVWGYVGENSEPFCVEFCNVHIWIKHFSFCPSVGIFAPISNFWTKWFKFITALLSNIREVSGLLLCRTSCFFHYIECWHGITCFSASHLRTLSYNLILCP